MNFREVNVLFVAMVVHASALAIPMSQSDLEEGIMRTTEIFDNPGMFDYEMRGLIRLCDWDTNRFTAALANLAVRYPEKMPLMLQEVRRYGNATNLPFLYACVTNSPHADCAVMACVRIGGVTSNLINALEMRFSETNLPHMMVNEICQHLLPPVWVGRRNFDFTEEERARGLDFVVRHAAAETLYVDTIDGVLKASDPTYARSRRRLGVMQALLAKGPHPSSVSYVTNVIHELTSCPETDLSD